MLYYSVLVFLAAVFSSFGLAWLIILFTMLASNLHLEDNFDGRYEAIKAYIRDQKVLIRNGLQKIIINSSDPAIDGVEVWCIKDESNPPNIRCVVGKVEGKRFCQSCLQEDFIIKGEFACLKKAIPKFSFACYTSQDDFEARLFNLGLAGDAE